MNNIEKFFNFIEKLSLLEINNIIEIFKSRYNFSLENNIVKNDEKVEIKVEKKDNYSIKLINIGLNKIAIIKLIKDINNLGLKEAKDLLESTPVLIKNNLNEVTMKNLKEQFEKLGATIEII